jgi:dienelactone hydrolase
MKYILCLGLIFGALSAQAKIQTKNVEYKEGTTLLEGYLAYDDALHGKRPGILVVHDWTGVGPYVKRRAEQLAKLGYVAFAADIYGQGVHPKPPVETGKLASQYKQDRTLTRARAKAGLDQLLKLNFVDATRVAVMGYCFGGMVALELGRSGAAVLGVVSVHGSLDTPKPEDAKNIKGHVLALHGADDPYVKKEQVQGFIDEMRAAHVDWQLTEYGGAVHAFSITEAGNDPSQGAAYNALADQRSWIAMQDFYKEIFKK